MDISKKKELLPLTSLRFFAAAIVVISHLGYDYHLGGMGVTFFFILSGFILSYNYADKLIAWSSGEIVRMWISRLSRIFPVHIFMFLLSIPLTYIYSRDYSLTDTLSNILLLQSWYPNGQGAFSFNGVSWTLSCELFFYITLPFILLISSKKALKLSTISLIVYMIIIMLFIWITSISAGMDMPEYSFKWWVYVISPYLRWMDFFLGIVLGFLFLKRKNRYDINYHITGGFEVCSITIMLISYFAFLKFDVPFKWNYSAYFDPIFSIVIYIFAMQRGMLSKILSNKAYTYLGKISFSIYMTHQVLMFYWNRYIYNLNCIATTKEEILNQLAYAFSVLAISSLTYHFIENPARKAIINYNIKK